MGEQHGFRNAQATVLAPTGTIGFMMDCDTTGVEPDIALVKYKKLVGGGMMKIVNQTVPMALQKLGYNQQQIKEIVEYIDENETIEGAPHLKDAHLPVFDCAFKPARGVRSIHYMGHIKMMGAAQPFLSGAISKTVNVPKEATSRRSSRPTSTRGGSARRPSRSTATAPSARSRSTPRATKRSRRSRPSSSTSPAPPQAARRAPLDHAQVRHRRPRGLHHRRPVRGRPARRAVPGDGEGRLDDLGLRRRVRAGDLATRSSTACRCRTWSTSSATSASSRRA